MKNRRPRLLTLSKILLFSLTCSAPAYSQTRQVTTYVFDVQEERQSTRWTLTEWLRIKERMKMMDVWLAMFSEPEEQRFAPELVLEYTRLKGDLIVHPYDNKEEQLEPMPTLGLQGRAQFWLTNLVSSTTGVKTLNIDLGIEAGTYRLMQPDQNDLQQATSDFPLWDDPNFQPYAMNWWTGNFRIFGASIQDTSLILKYGGYQAKPLSYREPDGRLVGGLLAGAETYLYLFSWLGMDMDYLRFGNTKGPAGSPERSLTMFNYGVFIEIYMLRIGYRLQELSGSWGEDPTLYEFSHEGPAWYIRLNL